MENLYENFKKYANKAYNQVAPLIPFSNANQYNFNPNSNLYQNTKELNIQNDTDILNQQMANYKANQNGTFMLNALTKSDEQKQKDNIDFDNKFIDLATAKGYTPHKAIDKDGKARYAIEKDGVFKEIEPSFLNDLKANSYEMLGSLAGVATALPHPLAKTAGVAGKILTPMVGSAVGSGAGAMADTYLNNKSVGEKTTAEQLANSFTGGANNDILGAGLATAITSKPAINIAKGTLKVPLEVLDKGLTGVGARHIMSQNIGGAQAALKANLGGDHEAKHALESAKDALGADLDNFVSKDLKTINKTSDNRYIQKGIDIANSAINKANETLKGLNVGKADAELLLSALGHENGVKNILDAVANNPQSAQKITQISSNLNKSFSDSINEQLAKFETQTPKDSFKNSFKNSFNQVKQDYADTKDFLVKNSNYQSDFKDLNENLATILNDTQNINTRGVFNALNGGGNIENLLNAKNAINEQLSYIMRADFKSSSDFINQKALSEAKSLIDNEINTALKNDENLINLYKSANGDYATMKNIVDSNLMSQISRDGKTSLEALNAMIKSNENINGVTLNDFLSSLGAKDRAIAEANIIKGLMEKNSVNGVVDFRALNQSLNSLDFGSEFAKELRSQILNRQALLNNTSDILNALGNKVVKSKSMSQGISTDPLKRAETMKANFIIEKIKPLIPKLGNNEALKLHLNRAILNANGDFKLAIKNIDNIPDGNLPTPTRNLLNEFKEAVKEIEKQVVKTDNQPNLSNQANLAQNSIKGDGFVISGNGVEPKSDLNVKISVDEWVKELAGINPNKQIIADLEHLYEKHKELFSKPSEVFKLIKAVKDNPTFFYTNNQPNIALIGSILENGKLGKIGIQKDFNSDNLQVRHATYSSNAKKENERLLKRNSYPVGSPTPTQLTFGKTAEPTANGAKTLLGKKEKAVSGDALPPHLDADNTSLTGRYSVGGKPHLTAFNENIIPQNAKNEVKEQAKITQINEQTAKAKSEPSPTKQEVDSLSEATPNLTRDGVVSEIEARNLVKNISLNKDIAIQLQPKADLLKLVKDFSNVIKTPIFESKISIDKLLNHLADKTDADKRLEYLNLIKPTLENPLFITRENNRYRFVKTFIDSDKITKFLSVIENDKGEFIGITATPIKNTDLKNLLKGNIVWGGDTLSTLSTPQIAKQEVEAISETIPNQSIKEAETTAKETTQEPQATTAKEPQEPTKETFDILKIDKNISDEQVETLLKEIEDKNLKVNLPLRDEEPLGKALQKDELGYNQKSLLKRALNEQFLKRHKGFIERAEKTQSKAEFQKFLKENKAEVVEYIKDMVTNTLRYIDAYGQGYHFTNKSSLRRANDMILNLQNGKNFYFYNKASNKITNPAPKSDYADKLVDGNEAIQGTYKLSDEIKQDLIKSLKEFVGARQNLADNIADIQSKWSHKIKEQERLAPSILEGGKKANNGYDENLLKALEHELYLFNQFERKIVKNPQKTSSDLELAKNYYRFSKGDTYTKQALDEINQTRRLLEQELNIRPIKEFGTNYAEFYHDGKGAINKLLVEKQGQVAGAFYDERFGDVGIVWGVEGTAKSDGWGIAKIAKYHPEALDKMEEMLKMPIIAQSENRIKLSDGKYFMSIRKDFNGEKQNWVLTAFEKEESKSVSGRRTNLSATQSASEKTTSQNTHLEKDLDISAKPITKGTNSPLNSKINSTSKEMKSQDQKAEQQAKQYAKWLSQANKMAPQAPDELYKAYDKAKKDLKPKK
ncbi:hypothetical protein CVIC8964_0819 [Campylobacter vicugnae]|uniref:Phage-Barnase-EndoU-ColicinE5/D-RelE-like nuclease domain-containing protein n=1 Tax=Campylobacter vicugnae TaxID=1660076 RepID=A0A1X9T182_9BACT|nr:PBECR2 nuclease fold domain-containing protein [Campylobacter sp. RM8964]ARR02231.1 hypothetical protein CVIC8964_0819 [Campylobacter sp. RM8964]